jgi:dihydrofolate reductase
MEDIMGKIIISENISVDGFGAGERLFEYVGQLTGEAARVLLDEALEAEALLLGRRSYEFFAARWPSRRDEFADRLNGMPKYVLSATLKEPAWSNVTVLSGATVSVVTALRQQLAGDIVVYGSIQLVRALLEHDLADELRLMVHPVLLGAGEPLFGPVSAPMPMRLASSRPLGDGPVVLSYQRVTG